MPNNPIYNLLIPFLLFSVNLVLKLLFLDSQSISGDEPFSIYHAQYSVPKIIDLLIQGNNPPLYEIMLHYWIEVFGIEPFSVRFPSALFSSMGAIFIYKIGQKFFNIEIALSSGLLYTFSNHHLFLAHTARVYPIFLFLAVWSMYLFLSYLYHPNKKNFWSLAIVNALMGYSHYFGFFIIAIQGISVLTLSRVRPYFLSYLKNLGITLLLYLPMIFVLVKRFYYSVSEGTWLDTPGGVQELYRKIMVFSNEPVVAVMVIAILAISLGLNLFRQAGTFSVPGKIIGIWFLFPFFFMFIVSFWVPMWFERYLTFMTPGFYLLATVAAFSIIKKGKWRFLLPGILVIGFIATFNPDMPRRNPDKAVNYVANIRNENTLVLVCPDYFISDFTYHYNKNIFQKTSQPQQPYKIVKKELAKQNIHFLAYMDEFQKNLNAYDKVIFLDAGASGSYPNNQIRATLENSFSLAEKKSISAYTIYVFQ